MKIYSSFPKFQDFVMNELETLTYLNTRGLLSYYNDLERQLGNYQSIYFSHAKKKSLNSIDLHLQFSMEVEKEIHSVLIGANVVQDFSECNYFLAILDNDDKKIIRKFHFDYADIKNETKKQIVPSFHLQYGGKMSPRMVEDKLEDEKLDHWLSLPRLNFHPMNLALLLDLTLCEFRTEQTKKIIETSEWRTLIFKNENFLKKSYYQNIFNHLNSASYGKNSLLRDYCYGE